MNARWWHKVGIAALVTLLMPAAGGAVSAQNVTRAQAEEYFETSIRPLLAANCYPCHGSTQQMGNLRLDSLQAILKGGTRGPAATPGSPERSLIVTAVGYRSNLKMPPAGKLPGDQVAALTAWIRMGAPWPAAAGPAAAAQPGTDGVSPAQRRFWSFQPVRLPAQPRVKDDGWVQSPVDRFVQARLQARGLKPVPQADRRTLIRRVTFDLIGLPPAPAAVAAFLNDHSRAAFARVVDRLLASPRYGERWGRHWLDVARYADTKGYVFTADSVFHNAYTYRDWVIDAFNHDLPYNKFVEDQLAADLIPGSDRATLAALGFLTLGRRFLNDPVLINDDRIDVTCRGLMGLTVGCARCHDHKFDPIPSRDYYALYGVFASSKEPASPVPISPAPIVYAYDQFAAKLAALTKSIQDVVGPEAALLRKRPTEGADALPQPARMALRRAPADKPLDDEDIDALQPYFRQYAQARIKELRGEIEELKRAAPPRPEYAEALEEEPRPFDPYVFIRGNPANHGPSTPREFLAILSGPDRKPFAHGSGRLEMADDIASRDNPLTARVLVNRVWMYHFGQGIVRTPGDFGVRGEPPSEPELLDWLAYEFTAPIQSGGRRDPYACGWSVKRLHRLILLSSAYQLSTMSSPKDEAIDPEDRLFWRQSRQRLDLESLRDSLLAVSGKLDMRMGGPAVDILSQPYSDRRTVYGFIERQNLPQFFRTFDFASPDTSNAERHQTTVPQQALYMMNSPFVVEAARSLAARPDLVSAGSSTRRIESLYRLLFGREPSAMELSLGSRFLQSQQTQHAPQLASNAPQPHHEMSAWERYVQALLMTNEFTFVD